MGRIGPYLIRRLIYILPQIVGVVAVVFFVVRLIPGDPARLLAGPFAPEEGVQMIREKMGLLHPLPIQFINYVKNVFQGDLGNSWYTGNPVATDIARRLPATLELLVPAILVTYIVMLPIALKSVSSGGGRIKKVAGKTMFGYGLAAGAFPDFWLALILVLIFYSIFHIAPAPVGRLDIAVLTPMRITGSYFIDSLVTGNWVALKSSFAHLVLPVFVLAFVYGGAILKIAIVDSNKFQKSEFANFARICGLPMSIIETYVWRATIPSVATITGVVSGFLIGGAVLVETVFSWDGIGKYAVTAVVNSDYAAIQGVVLVAAAINIGIYIVVDIIYFLIDPRIKRLG